jgi:hypothetical protein
VSQAVNQARRELTRTGHATLLWAAASKDVHGASREEQIAYLTEIADYIESNDPLMIAAAFLLEQEGYERGQVKRQLTLDFDASPPQQRHSEAARRLLPEDAYASEAAEVGG